MIIFSHLLAYFIRILQQIPFFFRMSANTFVSGGSMKGAQGDRVCELEDVFIEVEASIIYTMNAGDANAQQSTTMTKIIIIESQDVNFSQSFEVNIPYDSQHRALDLGHSLHHILHHNLNCTSQQQIFYFHPTQHFFEYAGLFPFKYPLLIGEDFIAQQQITVRIRRLPSEQPKEQLAQKQGKDIKQKKKRVGQRTIREVLEKVSEWREIAHKNPKINLQEAAKLVGIPKKTLDDYYGYIKLGSEYKFNFEQNIQQKIGVLRSFVRQKHLKKKSSNELEFVDQMLRHAANDSDDESQEEE